MKKLSINYCSLLLLAATFSADLLSMDDRAGATDGSQKQSPKPGAKDQPDQTATASSTKTPSLEELVQTKKLTLPLLDTILEKFSDGSAFSIKREFSAAFSSMILKNAEAVAKEERAHWNEIENAIAGLKLIREFHGPALDIVDAAFKRKSLGIYHMNRLLKAVEDGIKSGKDATAKIELAHRCLRMAEELVPNVSDAIRDIQTEKISSLGRKLEEVIAEEPAKPTAEKDLTDHGAQSKDVNDIKPLPESSTTGKIEHKTRFEEQIAPYITAHCLTIDRAKDFVRTAIDNTDQGVTEEVIATITANAHQVGAAAQKDNAQLHEVEQACASLYLIYECAPEIEDQTNALNIGCGILLSYRSLNDIITAGIESTDQNIKKRASRALDLCEIFMHRDPNHEYILEKRRALAGYKPPTNMKKTSVGSTEEDAGPDETLDKKGAKVKSRFSKPSNVKTKSWRSGLASNLLSKKSFALLTGLAAIGAAYWWHHYTDAKKKKSTTAPRK